MKTIAIVNQKGGVGKTTSCVNLGAALALQGQRVLLIDLDPQGSLTKYFGIGEQERTIYEAVSGSCPISSAILRRDQISIVPSDQRMTGTEGEFKTRLTALQDALEEVKGQYDYTLIDSGPALNTFAILALVAADQAIVPVAPQFLALDGLVLITDTIKDVSSALNKRLHLGGLIVTLYDGRRNLDRQISEEIRRRYPETFKSEIRISSKIAEAPGFAKTIFEYDPKCQGAAAYMDIASEILSRDQK